MTVNLYRLDSIEDYDEAIEALENYVAELVEEFVPSPEGKAYLKAHSDMAEYVGSWINHLLYFGYAYESVTLPHMTKNHVEAIVTRLFPNKVSLLNPDEADSAIPELIAFWQFLKRAYKHSNATKILKFLEKIQPQFKGMMSDPSKFGMAKSFLTAGMAAGFDITTPEGLKAFQEQYNQSIRESAANSPVPPGFGMFGFNSQNGNTSEATTPQAQLQNLLNALAAENVNPQNGSPSPSPLDSNNNVHQQFQSSIWQSAAEELPPLSEDAIALLKQQHIIETEPGTILRDFQTLLDFVGAGIPVSGTQHLLALNLLATLNERLSEPIQLDLKRPQQKSYPPINGLYLLLRASGLGQIASKGKKHALVLNSTLMQSWNSLNPTERYFTLLEAWLVRGNAEMLGERSDPLNEGTKCSKFWPTIPDDGIKFRSYAEQQTLSYWPTLHNLALMKMFGLLQISSAKPDPGKGWRVKSIKKRPLGEALMPVLVRNFLEHGLMWESEQDSSIPFGELQSALQPYFPEWQNNLTVPQCELRSGVYVFKVSLGKIWRRIAISSQLTLADLSHMIIQSVDFDFDHLDQFTYKNQVGRTVDISHLYANGSPSTDEVRIGDLPLHEGAVMNYVFDFGDWWEFNVQLEKIQTDDTRPNYKAILESHGEAPPQYPDWDEEN